MADVILKRIIRNDDGDWKKCEAKVKEAKILSEVVDGLLADLVKADHRMRELLLEAYRLAPTVETHFYASPLAPPKQTYMMKAHLKKLGWEGIRDIIEPSVSIDHFSKGIKDGLAWLTKFKTGQKDT